jgi:hypothetical protein
VELIKKTGEDLSKKAQSVGAALYQEQKKEGTPEAESKPSGEQETPSEEKKEPESETTNS